MVKRSFNFGVTNFDNINEEKLTTIHLLQFFRKFKCVFDPVRQIISPKCPSSNNEPNWFICCRKIDTQGSHLIN